MVQYIYPVQVEDYRAVKKKIFKFRYCICVFLKTKQSYCIVFNINLSKEQPKDGEGEGDKEAEFYGKLEYSLDYNFTENQVCI